MPNPLTMVSAVEWAGIEIQAIYYDGTNEVAVNAAVQTKGIWKLSTKDPVTGQLTWIGISDPAQTINSDKDLWIINLDPFNLLPDSAFFAQYRLGALANTLDYKVKELAVGSIKTPLLAIGVGQQITITLDQTMSTNTWTMKVIPPAALIGTNFTISNVVKSKTGVTFVITAPLAVSAGNLITVIAVG